MDKLEKELLNLKNEKSTIPPNILDKIDKSYELIRNDSPSIPESNLENLKTTFLKNKKFYLSVASFILVILVSFNTPVKALINELIFHFNNSGIEKAVSNNYNKEISNSIFENEDLSISLKNVMIDNINIALDFKIKVKSNKVLPDDIDLNSLNIDTTLSILDENTNELFDDTNSNLKIKLSKHSTLTSTNDNEFNLNILLTSSNASIPDLKTLNVNLKNISFVDLKNNYTLYKLDTNFKTSVSANSYKNDKTNYSFNSNDSNIKIDSLSQNPTGLSINFNYLNSSNDESIVPRLTLVDDTGTTYKIYSANEKTENGVSKIEAVFDGPTSFDKINKLTLKVKSFKDNSFDSIQIIKKLNS